MGGDDNLFFQGSGQGLDLVAKQGGLFKLQGLGGLCHLPGHGLDQFTVMAIEHHDDSIHHFQIRTLVGRAHARGQAVVHLAVETGTVARLEVRRLASA